MKDGSIFALALLQKYLTARRFPVIPANATFYWWLYLHYHPNYAGTIPNIESFRLSEVAQSNLARFSYKRIYRIKFLTYLIICRY